MSDNDVEMADRTPSFPHQDLDHEEFREFSLKHWPDSRLAGPGNSGITCLIATIRHLLGFIPQAQRNDVLRFADEAEQEQGVPKNQRGVLRAILLDDVQQTVEKIKGIFPEDTTCSFESLIASHPYRRSMWNNPVFQVYLRRVLGPKPKPDEHPSRHQEKPYFTWDGARGQTLSQHIAMQFGLKEKGKRQWLDMPYFPCFIALKYVSTNKDRHHYHDLSHFDIAVGHPDSLARYEAAVVVRLRDGQDGLDSLRLYGKYSTPLRQLQHLSAPWSNHWSIEQGGAFMIFYARNDCPVPMPARTPVEFRRSISPKKHAFYQRVIKELQGAGTEDEEEQDDADNGESATPVQDLSSSPKDFGQETNQAENKSPSSSPSGFWVAAAGPNPFYNPLPATTQAENRSPSSSPSGFWVAAAGPNPFYNPLPATTQAEDKSPSSSPPSFLFGHGAASMFSLSAAGPKVNNPFGSTLQSAATKPLSDDGNLDSPDREPSPSHSYRSVGSKDDSLPAMSSRETPRQGPSDFGLRTTPPSGQRPPDLSHGSTRHRGPLPPQSAIAPRSSHNKHPRDEQSQRQNAIKRQRVPAPVAQRLDQSHSPVRSGTLPRPVGHGLSHAGASRSPQHRRRQDEYRDIQGQRASVSNYGQYFDNRLDYGDDRQEYRSSTDGQSSSSSGSYRTAPTHPDEHRGRSRAQSPRNPQGPRDGRGGSRNYMC